MYNPDFKTVEELSHIKSALNNFNTSFSEAYDANDELDAQLKNMIDLLVGGFDSIYEEMKRRL